MKRFAICVSYPCPRVAATLPADAKAVWGWSHCPMSLWLQRRADRIYSLDQPGPTGLASAAKTFAYKPVIAGRIRPIGEAAADGCLHA